MELMDLAQSFDTSILIIILALVEFTKKLGLGGNSLLITSLVIGIVLGGGACISANGIPIDFQGWFTILVCGLGYGLVASGARDLVKNTLKNG